MGTWSRIATTQDAQALGLDPTLATEVLGADGKMPVDLEVTPEDWKIYVTSDQGKRELGDFGTWQADEEGRWVVRSESPGCRGCEAAYRIDLDGDRLTMQIDDGDAPVGEHHLVTEGTWTKAS